MRWVGSGLAQEKVQRPAAADVWAGAAQVLQQVGIGAGGFLKGVSQHRQMCKAERPSGKLPPVVSRLSEGHHLGRLPGRGDGDAAEWEGAEEVQDKMTLIQPFFLNRMSSM